MCNNTSAFKQTPRHIKYLFADSPDGGTKRKDLDSQADLLFARHLKIPPRFIHIFERSNKILDIVIFTNGERRTITSDMFSEMISSDINTLQNGDMFVIKFGIFTYGKQSAHGIVAIYDVKRKIWDVFDSAAMNSLNHIYTMICGLLNKSIQSSECKIHGGEKCNWTIQGLFPTCLLWANIWIYLRIIFFPTSPHVLVHIVLRLTPIENMCLFLKFVQDVYQQTPLITHMYPLDALSDDEYNNIYEPDMDRQLRVINRNIYRATKSRIDAKYLLSHHFNAPVFPSLLEILARKIRFVRQQHANTSASSSAAVVHMSSETSSSSESSGIKRRRLQTIKDTDTSTFGNRMTINIHNDQSTNPIVLGEIEEIVIKSGYGNTEHPTVLYVNPRIHGKFAETVIRNDTDHLVDVKISQDSQHLQHLQHLAKKHVTISSKTRVRFKWDDALQYYKR